MKTIIKICLICILGFFTNNVTAQSSKADAIEEGGVIYKKVETVTELLAIGYTPKEVSRIVEEGEGIYPDPNRPPHVEMSVSSKGRRAKSNYTCGWGRGSCWCSLTLEGVAIITVSFPEQVDADGAVIPAKDDVAIYYSSENNEVLFR